MHFRHPHLFAYGVYECTLTVLSNLPMNPITDFSPLVIDFSALQHKDTHPSIDAEVATLIGWIRSQPQRRHIRVYVKSGIVSASNRKVQSTLQSLGCTVIAKAVMPRQVLFIESKK
jgi:hypothetical protein